ncbi:mitogen-activated protein kinase kinase kinase NPK1 [Prosopis cineraria]|uniref:mitogen-activated protein kinase kinase kinase NPK1 n=1 Tax=Prosopis cineraria TaxID=364024 RepID=UPI00240F2528|nr:mitogen-activated protein kinase kinase kinase NPK1 [Prosopis cineraria]
MQEFLGSVRRSLVFRSPGGDDGGFGVGGLVDKIGSSIRKSRIGLFSQPRVRALPPVPKDNTPSIRWRKGELIGCGAFGRVYMGMNLDSGELIAVKQVLIAARGASKEKTQAHILELEEEVKLLKNLKHPNIVRYLGTAREEDSLNILLEFVPGGSISSLLGKFGSFPESVIKMYTKQLLLGLEYLHKNGIIHRDIKGANILVDNKGCIKLADFGASKKVVELATMNGAKSMKGTPYWMAPEVILQTGHSFSADIWSVGCTVIEMATGKPPWSEQFQEVAALFHIGTTKSHPPIPDHLSVEAKDFLLNCLQKEPDLRPSASDLLQHPFVTCEYQESNPTLCSSVVESYKTVTSGTDSKISGIGLKGVCQMDSIRCSSMSPETLLKSDFYQGTSNYDDDMCQIDDKDDLFVGASVKSKSRISSDDVKSFNPMCEPIDEWTCNFDKSPDFEKRRTNLSPDQTINKTMRRTEASQKVENEFSFPSEPIGADDDEEVTESKIRAFLDEKALELKKLQTPLYEEFFSISNAAVPPMPVSIADSEVVSEMSNVTPKSRSPGQASRRYSVADGAHFARHGSHNKNQSKASGANSRPLQEIHPSELNEWKETLNNAKLESLSASSTFSEIQRKWKEELVEELERKREMMRLSGLGGKITSPTDRNFRKLADRSRFAFPS